MSNGVIDKPVWLSLALVVAFSLVAPGSATRAAADELQQPRSDLDLQQSESALALVQPNDVLRADNVSQVSYADTEALEPDSESVSDCGPSCGGCCRCCPTRFFYAGTEATFLVPNFTRPMTFTVNDIGAGTTNVYSDDVTALDQMYVGPRVWLGVQGERWGVVTRFWELSDSQLAFDPLMPGETSDFLAAHRFEAYTIDLELTRRFWLRNSRMDFGVGIRYASIEHDSILSANEIIGIDLLSGSALATRQFDGTGITIGLEGRSPISSRRESNLYLCWKARGALMGGDIVNSATSSAR